jgi:hypothetical protein
MVANFVPSLLVGLQRTSGIDYDAVAYRTGVVLVEDPGENTGCYRGTGCSDLGEVDPSGNRPWEQVDIYYKNDGVSILRLGLAVSSNTPNILSINKINRFFCTTFFDDQFDSTLNDYRKLLLFSNYMYGYQITLKNISPMKPGEPLLNLSIGQPYPAGYGYIRRYVLIKQNTNATINMNTTVFNKTTNQLAFDAMTEDQVKQEFRIRFDGRILYNTNIDNPYKIDLLREPFTIKITNLSSVLNNSKCNPGPCNPSPIANNSTQWGNNTDPQYVATGDNRPPTNATLTAIQFYDLSGTAIPGFYSEMNLTVDGVWKGNIPPAISQVNVNDTIELSVKPLWPSGYVLFDKNNALEIGLVFQNKIPHTLVTGTFLYDYYNVTRPDLTTGMLEIGIW